MTTCHVCNQVVVFARQAKPFCFCSQACIDKFMQEAEKEWFKGNHNSTIPPKLSEVMFQHKAKEEIEKIKKRGMLGQ